MVRRRRNDKNHAEFAFGILIILLLVAFSITSLFQGQRDSFVQSVPTGYVVVPAPGGETLLTEGKGIVYADYENKIIAADTDYIVTLETSAEEGTYLAYDLDGEYRADVLVQGDGGNSFIHLLLNLERGLHEIRVYTQKDGNTIVERHNIVAI
ncbi:MAG: hypothetical protein HYW25_04285 [Candidatus Aenigmarchaeota archaeon]|nr:hypothetical protein [Candidatus Aenigmarchaeota archaeon]